MDQQGQFRGFDQQQLSQFSRQTDQPVSPGSGAPSHNWRYANPARNAQVEAQYNKFQNYQGDWNQNRYLPNRAPKDEMDGLLAIKAAERQNQMAMFEQKWQQQQQGGVAHDHIMREGLWARNPESATMTMPWPIHAQQWKGEEEFLRDLELVESFLSNQKIFFKMGLKCIVQGCGCDLQNAEFVDQTNKVAWPVNFIHYLGDHNNPPSRFFYDYIKKAANAIRSIPK